MSQGSVVPDPWRLFRNCRQTEALIVAVRCLTNLPKDQKVKIRKEDPTKTKKKKAKQGPMLSHANTHDLNTKSTKSTVFR